jgi:CRISPR-associated protein Cmr5
MTQTLDQQRAAFAWECAQQGIARFNKEYMALAKGAPALIMNSGLMPALAFYSAKSDASKLLLDDLIRGLSSRIWKQNLKAGQGNQVFSQFMQTLQQRTDSSGYMRATDEALEILKWIRQFVDAVPQGGRNHG